MTLYPEMMKTIQRGFSFHLSLKIQGIIFKASYPSLNIICNYSGKGLLQKYFKASLLLFVCLFVHLVAFVSVKETPKRQLLKCAPNRLKLKDLSPSFISLYLVSLRYCLETKGTSFCVDLSRGDVNWEQ